jgi:small subunit ribosomal protein S19
MTRSLKKGIYVEEKLMKKVTQALKDKRTSPIKTWSRRSTIIPEMVGFIFDVYNGHKFIAVSVAESMVGHKLGEFSPTRTFRAHSSKKIMEDTTTPSASSAPAGGERKK